MHLKKRFFFPFILFFITAIGTFGYMTIEGWSLFDSFYMTIITLTTIGYEELHPLSHSGRVFNVFIILIGVGTVTFTITKIITDIASIDFNKRRRSRMKKKIAQMKGHTIVCGYGRMGEVICRKLSEYKNDFVVIEKRPSLIDELKKTDFLYIEGDAANDDHLIDAGIKNAKVLVSVIDNDSDGLYIALAGRSINKDLFIIVRSNEQQAKKRILRAGADKVILPFVMSGESVADTVVNPATEDLFDIADTLGDEKSKIQLADLIVTSQSPLNGKNLEEMGTHLDDLIIIGIKDKANHFIFKPGGQYIFREGDCLVSMGSKKNYQKAKDALNLS